jgi:phosphatidylinositol 4-kinase
MEITHSEVFSNGNGGGSNLGSLLRLFKSDHFDAWMAISYLFRYSKQKGVFSYLCNEFYKLSDDDVEFYLAQICSLVVFQPDMQPLFGFLMDKASKSVHFAIKIAWMFSALSEPKNEIISDRCALLRKDTENSTMNQRRPDRPPDENITRDDPEEQMQFAISKIERCDYFKALQNFIEELGNISNRLRIVSAEERTSKLKSELMLLNKKLSETPGIYIPLVSSSHPHCCLVNIPPEESVLLNSRERAPFLIIAEVLESEYPSSCEQLHEYAKEYLKVFERVNNIGGQRGVGRKKIISKFINNGRKIRNQDTNSQNEGSTNIFGKQINSKSLPGESKFTSIREKSISERSPSRPNPKKQKKIIHMKRLSNDNSEKTSETESPVDSVPGSPSLKTSQDDWVVLQSPDEEASSSPRDSNEDETPIEVISTPLKRAHSILYLREKWEEKVERIRSQSPYGSLPNWKLLSLIVKFGDDCRQERMALQLINQFNRILTAAKLPLYLRPYNILVLSPEACIMETITNSMSIHQLKKEHHGLSIAEYFRLKCGGVDSPEYKLAQANFIESTAAYSIVTYLLQLKDRHNGNIMIDSEGHIIHIDFGFMLTNSPGSLNFETSPFKLTQEYIDFIGGIDSAKFQYFKVLVFTGFLEVRKYADRIIGLVEMILQTDCKLPCLVGGPRVVEELKERFVLSYTDRELEDHINSLINQSINNWRTEKYDQYQYLTNGILH